MRRVYQQPYTEDFSTYDALSWLERQVSQHYLVSPVDSRKAYEVIAHDGQEFRLFHKAFAYGFMEDSKSNVLQACELLWKDLASSLPKGVEVIWRRRPTLEQREEICECCGNKKKRFSVYLRIGTLKWNEETRAVPEGSIIPDLPPKLL